MHGCYPSGRGFKTDRAERCSDNSGPIAPPSDFRYKMSTPTVQEAREQTGHRSSSGEANEVQLLALYAHKLTLTWLPPMAKHCDEIYPTHVHPYYIIHPAVCCKVRGWSRASTTTRCGSQDPEGVLLSQRKKDTGIRTEGESDHVAYIRRLCVLVYNF